MRPIELEIYPHGEKKVVRMEVEDKASLGQIAEGVRKMVRTCGWVKARIGIGSMWSAFIY